MDYTDRKSLEKFLSENLSERRYRHSLGVEDMAVRLADLHGGNASKAAFAGRYHDIAKNFDQDRMDSFIRKYGLSENLLGNTALAHSKVGAAILADEFGVNDEDILNAVRFHTTARKEMSLLEEIVFVADVVEDNRTYNSLEYYQNLAYRNLDRACLEILEYICGDLESKGRIIDKDTLEARDWIRDKIKESE